MYEPLQRDVVARGTQKAYPRIQAQRRSPKFGTQRRKIACGDEQVSSAPVPADPKYTLSCRIPPCPSSMVSLIAGNYAGIFTKLRLSARVSMSYGQIPPRGSNLLRSMSPTPRYDRYREIFRLICDVLAMSCGRYHVSSIYTCLGSPPVHWKKKLYRDSPV
jgi:hypothetical protein